MQIAIADATLTWNNKAIAYVPNSLKYTLGKGEKNVRSQSSGSGNSQTILTRNAETRIGKVMVSLYPTSDNIELIRDAQNSDGDNALSITGSGVAVSFNNMAITNDPEIPIGTDTTIEVEFMGDPAI